MSKLQEEWILFKEITRSNQYFKKGDILTVSDWGRVKCNGEFHKCSIVNGYYRLCGERLHRIIAEKFLDNWDPNKEVDHKDCNPLNNMVTNLLICDHNQNMNNPLTRKHMSDSKTGCIPWNKGKHGLQTAWNKNKSLSEEQKQKISKSLKGNIPWNKGKNQTEEQKQKISKSKKGTHRVYRTDGTWYMKKED